MDWLAEAGQSWWQILPLGPPDETGSPYMLPPRRSPPGTGFSREPDAHVTSAERASFSERHRFWAADWEASPARARSTTRCGSSASGARCEPTPPRAGCGSSATFRSTSPRAAPTCVRIPRSSEAASLRGAAGRPQRDRAALGKPALRLAGASAPSTTAGGWSAFGAASSSTDLVRLDHFRGFVSYWAVPADARNAAGGRWQRGPGAAVFAAARRELGALPLLARTSGSSPRPSGGSATSSGCPGMAVLQFAFDERSRQPTSAREFRERLVVYTGTHDTDTALGWWQALGPAGRAESGLDPAEPNWSLIELALRSRASLAVVPAQDLLGLGSGARMNSPGTTAGNWTWRLERGALTPGLAARLRALSAASGRVAQSRLR